MGNIIAERVKDIKLTKSQKLIAEYFINNQDRICNLSSQDLAKEIGVSDASIIRFSRAVGFEGYADLKNHMYGALVASARGNMSLSERFTKNVEKYGADPLHFQQLVHENIDSVFRNNSPEDFEAVTDALINANSRYIIGLRGCRGIAFKFGRLLAFMLPAVHTLTDTECSSIHNLQDINKQDVLLMIVYSRFYKIDLHYVKMAKERGAKVCIITDQITGPLTPYADNILLVSSNNMSFFHSTLAADTIIEYIANRISTQVDFKERMDEQDRITQDQRL